MPGRARSRRPRPSCAGEGDRVADAAWSPDRAQQARLRPIVRQGLALIAVMLVWAAGMARHGGLAS